MTGARFKELAFAYRASEQAEYLLVKITRMLTALDDLKGADREWLRVRRAELVEQAGKAEAILKESRARTERFTRVMAKCPDPQTYEILHLRYERQKSWKAVALHIGGGNTADGVRKRAARYLATIE